MPMFSCKYFIVCWLTFRSLIHSVLCVCVCVCVYAVREYSNFILLHLAVQFSHRHLLKRLSFLHCVFVPHLP